MLFDEFETLIANLSSEGVEARTALLPVPGAISHGRLQILRPGLQAQVIAPKRAERAPALLITAAGIPGEVHVHLSTSDKGHERLILRLVEPEGLHSTGHDTAELFNGKRGLGYQLVTTDDVEEAVTAIRRWVNEMRQVNSIDLHDRSAELTALHRERRAWVARLLQTAPDLARRSPAEQCDLCDVEWSGTLNVPDSDGAGSFELERANLAPVDLVWNFPRGKRGTIGKAHVLLGLLDYGHDDKRHTIWLTASSNTTGRIGVGVQRFAFADEKSHRWDAARWLWDRRAAAVGPDERWGLDVKRFSTDETDPARQSIELLQRCEFDQAFNVGGVDLSDDVKRLAAGRRLGFQRSEPTGWGAALAASLARSAPWLIGDRAADYVVSHYRTRFAKLQAFPGQGQIRRASLVLAVPKHARPRIEIRWTGTPHRLPEVLWIRPPELDLMLLGVPLVELLPPR